jgi:hypothetical protein
MNTPIEISNTYIGSGSINNLPQPTVFDQIAYEIQMLLEYNNRI